MTDVMGLSDIIGRSITLEPTLSGNHIGVCPLCNHPLPSLTIDNGLSLFHCTNCDAAGDAFSWTMRRYDCTFQHALKIIRLMMENHSEG